MRGGVSFSARGTVCVGLSLTRVGLSVRGKIFVFVFAYWLAWLALIVFVFLFVVPLSPNCFFHVFFSLLFVLFSHSPLRYFFAITEGREMKGRESEEKRVIERGRGRASERAPFPKKLFL